MSKMMCISVPAKPLPCPFRVRRAVTAYHHINLASKDHETSTADDIPARQNSLFISSSDLTLHHKPQSLLLAL